MASFLSTENLARNSARRPWLVVGIWVLVFLVGGFMASRIGDVLTNEQTFVTEPDSVKGYNLVEERLRGPARAEEFIIVRSETATVDDPQFRAFVDGLVTDLRAATHTDGAAVLDPTATFSFYDTADQSLVSQDRRITIVVATLNGELFDAGDNVGPVLDIVHAADGQDGFEVLTAGVGSVNTAFQEIAERDLQQAEGTGIPIALVILVVVFGALVAAGIPIVMALVAISLAIGSSFLIGQVFDLSFFVTNMITMIGLAVGIDYTLFIIERFREERARGLSVADAVTRAGATAGRAIFFSGGTVVIALMGLLIVPTNIFRSLAIGAIAVVIWAVILALTLLPAVLRLLGDRVNAPRLRFPRHPVWRALFVLTVVPVVLWLFLAVSRRRNIADVEHERGFWANTARAVMTRPWLSVGLAGALLVGLTVPYFTIDLGFNGISSLPERLEQRRHFSILQEEFSVGLLAPTEIVVDAPNVNEPAVLAGIQRLVDRIGGDPLFVHTTVETNPAGDLALISAIVNGEATSGVAQEAIDTLRETYVPEAFAGVDARVYVSGEAAFNHDFFALVDSYTPVVFLFVLSLSFLLLLIAFRSLVVPAKAVVMNLLSVGASYGLLVLVFQHGVGNELFGFQQVDVIEAWIPLFMFSVLFGLSMDYHVFLLSRIRERFDHTGNNQHSVSFGLRSTARIITGAALIMVAVFSGFASGELVMFQQMGFGLAVAVILDATVVRMVLVPASMQLLGRRNWFFPRWLEWLPDLRVEGGPPIPPAAKVSAGAVMSEA